MSYICACRECVENRKEQNKEDLNYKLCKYYDAANVSEMQDSCRKCKSGMSGTDVCKTYYAGYNSNNLKCSCNSGFSGWEPPPINVVYAEISDVQTMICTVCHEFVSLYRVMPINEWNNTEKAFLDKHRSCWKNENTF
jgi:hypothetical protein